MQLCLNKSMCIPIASQSPFDLLSSVLSVEHCNVSVPHHTGSIMNVAALEIIALSHFGIASSTGAQQEPDVVGGNACNLLSGVKHSTDRYSQSSPTSKARTAKEAQSPALSNNTSFAV